MVGCSDQCNYYPTIYLAARPRVGLFQLHRGAVGYAFKSRPRLHTEEAIYRYNKWGEVVALPEASLQVLTIFLLLRRQEALLRPLVLVREGVSVHCTSHFH